MGDTHRVVNKVKLVAKAVLINEKGMVLILTRSATDVVRPGQLDLPGGGIDKEDASYSAAVLREIREEAGLELSEDDIKLVFTDTSYFDGQTTIRFLYAASISSTVPITLSYEHSEQHWMNMAQVESEYNHPVWVKGIKYAVQHNLLPATITP